MIWAWVTKKLATSILSRWVLGGLVASVIAFAAFKWHEFKEDLIHKGQQVCVQEINRETVEALERALAEERATATRLRELATAAAQESAEARARRREMEIQISSMARAMREQEKTDETYKTWAHTPVPDGVADRLRNAAAGSDSDSS